MLLLQKNLVQKPPRQPAQPTDLIHFGSFLIPLPSGISSSGLVDLAYVGDKFEFHLERGRVLRISSQLQPSDATCTAKSQEANKNSNLALGCSRCLGAGHERSSCVSKVRCRACYNYGHVQRRCLSKARPNLVWIRKETPANRFDCKDSLDSRAIVSEKPDFSSSQTKRQLHPQPSTHPPPCIPMDQVFDLSDDDSTSSIDASSPLVDEVVLKFMASYKLRADQLLLDGFTRSSIYPLVLNSPNVTTVQALAPVRTLVLDKRIFSTQEADEVFVPNGLDLVPWRPVVHAIMLKVLAENLEHREESTVTNVEPVAHVQEDGSNVTMGPRLQFEFESS